MSDSDLRRCADKCDGPIRDDCTEPKGTPNDEVVFAELMPMPRLMQRLYKRRGCRSAGNCVCG
jgi:hypothetical protein